MLLKYDTPHPSFPPEQTSGLRVEICFAQIMITRLWRNEGVYGLIWRITTLCAGFFVAPMLVSCVQGNNVSHPNSSPTVGVPYAVQATRPTGVIVIFNRSVPFSSDGFLLDMQSRTHARFSYIGSGSNGAHIYGVQPFQSQTIEQVLQRVSNLPEVRSVEVDQIMRIN